MNEVLFKALTTPVRQNYAIHSKDVDAALKQSIMSKKAYEADLAGKFDAQDICDHIVERLKRFEATLDATEELGIRVGGLGWSSPIHFRGITYKNPNLIEFTGVDPDANRCELIQHVSRLDFMIVALKKLDEEPYRIGFLSGLKMLDSPSSHAETEV